MLKNEITAAKKHAIVFHHSTFEKKSRYRLSAWFYFLEHLVFIRTRIQRGKSKWIQFTKITAMSSDIVFGASLTVLSQFTDQYLISNNNSRQRWHELISQQIVLRETRLYVFCASSVLKIATESLQVKCWNSFSVSARRCVTVSCINEYAPEYK